MEGESVVLYTAKRDLISALHQEFPSVSLPSDDSSQWIVEPSSEILSAAKIMRTHESIRRDGSSGEVSSSKPLAQPDLDALSLTSTLNRALLKIPGINIVSRVLQATGKITKIVVNAHYKNRKFLSECESQLEISLPARKVWFYADGGWGQIKDVEAFQDGKHYYVTAETDPDPVLPPESPQSSVRTSPETKGFATMQEFYGALRSVDCDDDDIKLIDEVFKEQRIKVSVLSSLTYYDLKDYGVQQLGLRKAILKVLGKE
ncbi:hypothetical protein MP638_001405 [Amoeboaphelidium occidentale]|nr:hypothetical protein MP638_001405 [Amoeboaphelidium occidentale]